MDGAQIPLDAADRQAPFFPQRGDAAEHVDAQALAPQCHAVQLCWGYAAASTRWAGPGDADMLGDLHRNHRQLDDFPGALDPAASQVRPAIGTSLHHVLHPMGRCHTPAGVAVVARPFLGQTVGLADGGVQVDGQRPVAGSGSSRPGPGQQLPADPIQLADMAPPETAQEGPQGGWRLDYAADGASRPAGAQHVGVVNAVSSGHRKGHQGHNLVARVRPARRSSEVNVTVDEFTQTQGAGRG